MMSRIALTICLCLLPALPATHCSASESKDLPLTIPVTDMQADPRQHSRVAGLVLAVEDAGWPSLSILSHRRGLVGALRGSRNNGGHLTPIGASLGCVAVGAGGRLIHQEVNEVSNSLTFGNGKDALKVTVTRLSPAILFESDSREIELSGLEEKSLHEAPAKTLPPSPGSMKPLRWATPGPDGNVLTGVLGRQPVSELPFKDWEQRFTRPKSLAVGKLAVPPLGQSDEGWLLLWYGSDSPFVSAKFSAVLMPGPFHPSLPARMKTAYQADVPLLLVFENAPNSVNLEEAGQALRLKIAFAKQIGKAAMLPLYGHILPPTSETETWLTSFPPALKSRCDAWAARLGRFPMDVKETPGYDANTGRVTLTEEFEFVQVRSGARPFAPLPAMLALGYRQGLPVRFSARPEDAQLATQFGPVMHVAGRSYTWSLDGLGRYVYERQGVGQAKPKAAELERELGAEIDKVLAAGHLAPWILTLSAPYLSSRGTTYWTDPSESFYLLAETLPLLPSGQQAKLREYLTTEYATHAPEKVLRLQVEKGARRERYDAAHGNLGYNSAIGGGRLRQGCDEFYEPAPFLYRAYGVARYYLATGGKPKEAVLDFWRQAMRSALEGRQWDTLGWFQGKYVVRISKSEDSYHQYALRCVHRDIAGLIGYLRLCAAAGPEAEPEAWGQFARLAALRFALARYGRYLATSGLFEMSDDDKAIAFLQRGHSTDPGKPENHIEQVLELNQYGVVLGEGATSTTLDYIASTFHVTFRDMVPEVGRMLADWGLGEDVRRYLDRLAMVQPNWYAAYADAFTGREIRLMYPAESYQMFMAHAWIARTGPDVLQRYIDFPWTARGDLYYIHKLAETIKAYRGVTWAAGEQ